MESIGSVLEALLDSDAYNREALAARLGVTTVTVSRWERRESKPRPALEGELRELHAKLQATFRERAAQPFQWALTDTRGLATQAVDATLRELREILHRRGRISSRQEALDEISKLLFAHLLFAVRSRGLGISRTTVLTTPAQAKR